MLQHAAHQNRFILFLGFEGLESRMDKTDVGTPGIFRSSEFQVPSSAFHGRDAASHLEEPVSPLAIHEAEFQDVTRPSRFQTSLDHPHAATVIDACLLAAKIIVLRSTVEFIKRFQCSYPCASWITSVRTGDSHIAEPPYAQSLPAGLPRRSIRLTLSFLAPRGSSHIVLKPDLETTPLTSKRL
jgi:hypothetical protein